MFIMLYQWLIGTVFIYKHHVDGHFKAAADKYKLLQSLHD